ncbi:anti-phage deoxyguanosine triphosphatase [Pseudidiomarina gelatinasegens]|nr:anti-phage deoxyguanosine triphosphatase [Pseudidiomarina gelatinasegens]
MDLVAFNQVMSERRDPTDQKYVTDIRHEDERDNARIIHSAAFRRLQTKTQVLGLGESDFYRTRLTHSMEVKQVGIGILKFLERTAKSTPTILGSLPVDYLPTSSQLSTICLAHDIGHPPFGHGGEVALNYCMRGAGGFEGNGQTLKILGKLAKYRAEYGLNATRRTLLGVLKYPIAYSQTKFDLLKEPQPVDPNWLFNTNEYKPPKCYFDDDSDIIEFILKPFSPSDRELFQKTKPKDKSARSIFKSCYHSLDTSIMSLADDISYGVHDLEDGISLGFITRQEWDEYLDKSENLSYFKAHVKKSINVDFFQLVDELFSGESHRRKQAIGKLVHLMVSSISISVQDDNFKSPIVRYVAKMSDESSQLLDFFQSIVREEVIRASKVQQLEFKGQKIVFELFQAIASDPKRFMPKSSYKKYEDASNLKEQRRVICNYISGMTDDYAIRMYEKIFVPRKGSVFDQL